MDTHQPSAMLLGEFDWIIAGAGTAGCVLANRLSADASKRVLLLESGGHDNWIWIHIPAGYLYCIANPRTDWMFKTEPEPGLNGRSIHYARGRVLGGCSSINGMIYMRGQARDYDEWASLTGDSRWSWEQVLPVFRQTEDHWAGSTEFHGAGGEWRVERQRLGWEILDAFAKAADQAGIAPVDDFNRGDNTGSSKFEVNQRQGVRWNASKAFLKPIMNRPNLTVLTQAHIEHLMFDERSTARIAGVRFRQGGQLREARARIEVVLAAGAIGSPHILQRSGIGDPAMLQAAGVSVRHALAGVGHNLQDHLQLRMAFRVHGVKTLNQQANSLFGKAAMALEYLFKRSGPLTMAPSQLGVFARSGPGQATADLQYHVQPLSLPKFGEPLHPFPAFTASVCHLRPTSRGTVSLRSPDPGEAPRIAPAYLSTAEDRRVAAAALRLTRRIVGQPALAPYQPQEFLPGPGAETDEDLARAAGDIGTTIFHPVGTCRMGRPNDPASVVDSELRVLGLKGLRVVDASIMPTITSGNTNSPTVMIAERGAALMLAAAKE
jgi:choline dehydrogenase